MRNILALSSLFLTLANATPILVDKPITEQSLGKPGNATFDYVIVGGGTAGLTVAVRLAENPALSIAVVEAGDFYELINGNQSIVPAYAANISPLVDWGFSTTPQSQLQNRTLKYNRGKALGGSSAINLMNYHRSTRQAHDKWAKAVGDESYSWSNFLQYYRKSVKYDPPNAVIRALNASIPDPSPEAYSKSGGPLHVSHANWANPVASYVGDAWKEIGVGTLNDLSSGDLLGNQYSPATVRLSDETRSSSESSFLQSAFLSGRSNLKVYKTTLAKKILFDHQQVAEAVLVETNGVKYVLRAKKEIVLSAGAFQSPQLLMISGVGPADKLKRHNIEIVADRRGVGQNMQDHIYFTIVRQVSTVTESRLFNAAFAATAEKQYNTNATGILTSTGADHFGWEKLPAAQLSLLSANARADLATFPSDWPDHEVVIGNLPFTAGGDYAQAIGMLQASLSQGTIDLASSDSGDHPLIDLKIFSNPTDKETCVQVFKRTRALLATKAMQPILLGQEVFPGPAVQSDAQILEFLIANVAPSWHASSTCSMGKRSDPNAVLDSNAKVIGVKSLRVVDTSSFPFLPPGHPVALTYALAEKIADDIKHGR